MKADHPLADACKEWRRLAQAEGEAIRTLNWPLALDCQQALQQLQPRMLRQIEAARQEGSQPGVDRAAREESFRAAVAELIDLETRNSTLLDHVRQTGRSQLSQLEHAGRTLRRVKHSYLAHDPAARHPLA
jgi:hypothetical protein